MGLFDGKIKDEYLKCIARIEALEKEKQDLEERNLGLSNGLLAANDEILKYKELLKDDNGKVEDSRVLLKKLQDEIVTISNEISDKRTGLDAIRKKYIQAHDEYIVMDELVLLQSFGLYEKQYDYSTSQEYQVSIRSNIEQQKSMIKNKSAAVSQKNWALEGSLSKGRKFIDDNIKLALKTFNIECDNAIKKVKFNNFEMSKKRIIKSFDSLNKLNSLNAIVISDEYLSLKLEQLVLEHEMAQKKQEEKEELRRQRELRREELRVAKELEEKRIEIEKEKEHYQNALSKLLEQMNEEEDSDRLVILRDRKDDYQRNLDRIQVSIEEIDYREANKRAGYVYVISNIGAFGEGIYKIGMTRRLEPQDRVDELGGASVPFRFDVHGMIFSDDAPSLENALHKEFADKKVNRVNWRKEYFRVSLEEIEKVINENHDEVVKLNRLHTAQQFRETQAIEKVASNN